MLHDEKEFREALSAVLTSTTFERAERLKKFLSFVCDLVLAGKGDEINEHLIGIEVFERRAGYSPSEDSIVRRQAHALRKKLEEYYRGPGAHSKIRIELPLGHYAPAFRVIEEDIQPVAAPESAAVTSWLSSPRLLAFAAGIVLVFALGWIAGHISRPPGATVFASDMPGSMRWIWRQWLSDPSGATICLTTPQTIVVKRYPELHADSKIEELIPETSPRARTLREFFHLPPGGALVEYPSVGQAKMGEAIAAIRLASLFAAHGAPIQVEHASFLEWNQARNENLIVFGHSESTPWIDRLIAGYPVRTEASYGSLPKRITVAHPALGERSMYAISESDRNDVYALISMVPGIDGHHRLLVVSGLSGMASQFGAEFLTTPAHVEELAAALRAAGAKSEQPPFFQAVLQVNVHDNTIPLKGKIELVRMIAPDAVSNVSELSSNAAHGARGK